MVTFIDKAFDKHSKTLILVFSTLVIAATLPTIASGLFSSDTETKPTKSIPPEQKVDDEYSGEPKNWTEDQLKAWLEKVRFKK